MQRNFLNISVFRIKSCFLILTLFCIGNSSPIGGDNKPNPASKTQITTPEECDVSPLEDLMREHGVLSRIFLIYEHVIQMISNNEKIPLTALSKAVEIIQTFIEEYHEKEEENYLFPLFEKNKRELELVKTLRDQHIQGRTITATLQNLIAQLSHPTATTLKAASNQSLKNELKENLKKFTTLYRPHAAREDTVLYPQLCLLISKKDFDKLGEQFEDFEHKAFGDRGFESVVQRVAAIEKELGIYTLK